MALQCAMCPSGKCSEDCPFLDVLPLDEGPLKEEIIVKAKKLQISGRDMKEMKQALQAAGTTLDAKNQLINKWIKEIDLQLRELVRKSAMVDYNKNLIHKLKFETEVRLKLAQTVNDVVKEARDFVEKLKADEESATVDDEGLQRSSNK